MLDDTNLVDKWQYSQRIYRVFIYFGSIVSFLILITIIILKNVYGSATESLFTETTDSIVFEIGLLCSGAFFGSSVIGIIFDQYQKRFVQSETQIAKRFLTEGIIQVFKSASDPNLINFLLEKIANAKSEVIATGLGLGIFAHNRDILNAISSRLNEEDNFRVNIYLGSESNVGVANRIKEEKEAHARLGLNYDTKWISRYPAEIKGVLLRQVDPNARSRLKVEQVQTCPMISVIKIDNIFLFFPYGTPDIRGSQSPWLSIKGDSDRSEFAKFLRKVISFHIC